MSNLLLDERLLSWVFLPIIFISTMITLLRMYYTKYKIISTMRPPIKKFKRADARDEVIRFKCEQLVMKSSLLTEEAFNARRGFLCKPEVGFLVKEGNREPLSAEANMAAMQSGMMDGMLGNLLTPLLTLPMIFMVNYFFDGLVVAQTPFSLTQQFKGMTQTGIFMENLDASYVSGMFFYLLMVFGLQKAIFLFMSDYTDSEYTLGYMTPGMGNMQNPQKSMTSKKPTNPMMNPMTQNQPVKDIFKGNIESLYFVNHRFALYKSTDMALQKLTYYLTE